MRAQDPLCRDDDASYDEASALGHHRDHHLGVHLHVLQNHRAHRDRHLDPLALGARRVRRGQAV